MLRINVVSALTVCMHYLPKCDSSNGQKEKRSKHTIRIDDCGWRFLRITSTIRQVHHPQLLRSVILLVLVHDKFCISY